MSVPSCRVLQINIQPLGKHLWEQTKLWGASGHVPAERRRRACLLPIFITGGVSADKERTPESQEGGAEGRFGGNDCLLLMFDAND